MPFTMARLFMMVTISPTFSKTSSDPTCSMSGTVISNSITSFLVWKYVPVGAGPESSSSSKSWMIEAFSSPVSSDSESDSEPELESDSGLFRSRGKQYEERRGCKCTLVLNFRPRRVLV